MGRRRRISIARALMTLALGALAVHALTSASRAEAVPSGFLQTTVYQGLTKPTDIRFTSDGRIFIAEKRGVIKVFDGPQDTTPTVFGDIQGRVMDFWDRGLLSILPARNFPLDQRMYAIYTWGGPVGSTVATWGDSCPDPPGATTNGCVASGRLSVFSTASGSLDASSENILVNDWCQQFPSHSIGNLEFGADGALFATGGEGASFNFVDYGQTGYPNKNPCGDPPGGVGATLTPPTAEGGSLRSQDLRTSTDAAGLDGSVIRVDPTTAQGLPDNPLAGSSDANARRIVAYGFRNPFRFTLTPGTNDIWVGDVGQDNWEELDRVQNYRGTGSTASDYGWPCYEGSGRRPGFDAADVTICENLYAAAGAVVAPAFTYAHGARTYAGDTCGAVSGAVTGVAIAPTGGSFPSTYDGALFFTDYVRGCVYVARSTNGVPDWSTISTFASGLDSPVSLRFAPDGSLWVLSNAAGTATRFSFTPVAPTARMTASPTNGLPPLQVSFDGTASSDPDSTQPLQYAWDLDGDGAFDDSTSPTPTFTYTQSGTVTARLKVTDVSGLVDIASTTISVGNTPPVPVIGSPTAQTTWSVGDPITLSGSATDGQDSTLGSAALHWSVIIHHCAVTGDCHEHDYQEIDGATGQFAAPDHEYPSYLEVRLTATDSGGLTATASVRLDPKTVHLTTLTDPPALQTVIGDATGASPLTQELIKGSTTSVSAATPQLGAYTFSSWSDGGARAHNVTVNADTELTAQFTPSTPAFQMQSGMVVMEAEDANAVVSRSARSWVPRQPAAGYSGTGAMALEPDGGLTIDAAYPTTSPELRFDVDFPAAGTYTVWLRGIGPNAGGDSVHVGFDEQALTSSDRMAYGVYGSENWFKSTMDVTPATITVPTAGRHAVNVWMREDGFVLDKLLLTSSTSFTPTGTGPAESPRVTGVTAPAITSRTPADGATGVALDVHPRVAFSQAMDPATVTGTTLRLEDAASGSPVAASITAETGNAAFQIVPGAALSAGATYRVRVTTGVKSSTGVPLAAEDTWTFTTAAATSGSAFQMQSGMVVMEAEDADATVARSARSWVLRQPAAGYSGTGAMSSEPDGGLAIDTGFATTSPELQFAVDFPAAGTYTVWVRGIGPNAAGDSLHAGLDGQAVSTSDRMSFGVYGSENWFKSTMDTAPATITVATAGRHTVNIWMREDGFVLDKLLLTSNTSFTPTGTGPAESPRA